MSDHVLSAPSIGARSAPAARADAPRRSAKSPWFLASALLHAAVFGAFAATFDGPEPRADRPATVTSSVPEVAPALDATPPEPPREFPEVAPPDAPSDADLPDDPLAEIEADLPDFRDPRELLADGRPTIGLGPRSAGFRRGGTRRASVATAMPPARAPEVAPAPSSPTALVARTVGPTRPARFAAPPTPPSYPEIARRRSWEGVVHLRIDVTTDGSVADVVVLRSSGRPALDDAAVEAARAWHFEPALLDGAAVADTIEKDVRFRLED